MAASDFTRDRSFEAIGLRVSETTSPSGDVTVLDSRLDSESPAIGFNFTATGRKYQAFYSGDAITVATEPETYSPRSYQGDVYVVPMAHFRRTTSLLGTSYVGYVDWVDWADAVGTPTADPSNRQIYRYMLFGARTVTADLPTTGSQTFGGQSSTYGWIASEGRTASIVVDFAARTVSVTTIFRLPASGSAGSGSTTTSTPITMTGVLDPSSGRISGTVVFDAGASTGTFEGALYGPGPAEAGVLFKVEAYGKLLFGYVVARR